MASASDVFRRNGDGSWTCIADATLFHPCGRVQVTEGSVFLPGVRFMGIDIVAWLEGLHPQGEQRLNS